MAAELEDVVEMSSMSVRQGRPTGVVLATCFVVAGAALIRRAPADQGLSSVYPWWTWVLVMVGLTAALAVVLASEPLVLQAAAGAGAVVSLQLAGTGVVARKHVRPAVGTGGMTGNIGRLELMAVLLAVSGLVAAVVCVGLLWRSTRGGNGSRPGPGARTGCLVVGLCVAVLVPLAVGSSSLDMRDVTSLGAVGLIYSVPWAAGLVVAGWLSRRAGVVTVAVVALSALLSLVGPQLPDLMTTDPRVVFGAAVVSALGVLALVARSGDHTGRRRRPARAEGRVVLS